MDIGQLAPSERIIEIKHPGDDSELGIRVSLMSTNDERMKSLKRRIQDRRIKLEQRGKTFTAADLDENKKEVAFASMTGWEFYGEKATYNGKKPDFNKATVLEIFEKLPWFLDQIFAALGEEKDFFLA